MRRVLFAAAAVLCLGAAPASAIPIVFDVHLTSESLGTVINSRFQLEAGGYTLFEDLDPVAPGSARIVRSLCCQADAQAFSETLRVAADALTLSFFGNTPGLSIASATFGTEAFFGLVASSVVLDVVLTHTYWTTDDVGHTLHELQGTLTFEADPPVERETPAVPEPSALALMSVGLVTLFRRQRMRLQPQPSAEGR
jgi:hypothetical protein